MVSEASFFGTVALSYPPRVRVRATVKLSAALFHDESSITMGRGEGGEGRYESAIAPFFHPIFYRKKFNSSGESSFAKAFNCNDFTASNYGCLNGCSSSACNITS